MANLTREQMIEQAKVLPQSGDFSAYNPLNYLPDMSQQQGLAPQPYQNYELPANIAALPQAQDAQVSSDMPTPTQGTVTPMPGVQLDAEQMRHMWTQLDPMVAARNAPPALPGAMPGSAPPQLASMQPSVSDIARGEIARGTAMEKKTTQDIDEAKMLRADANADLAGAEAAKVEIERQKGEKQYKIDTEATERAQAYEKQMQMITERGQAAAEVQMRRVQSAADDAAQASMHNFWADKSSGARVLGILAQAFSGAANGLAGNPSAPTPLDRVIQRDMEIQMQNMQQKNRNVENQRGVLRDLYEKTGTMQQAATAMYLASWKRIERQGAQLNSQFANETASAAMKNVSALVKARTADVIDKSTEQLRAQSIQEQQHGANLLAEDERTGAMAGARTGGENAQIYHLAGMKGNVDKRTYEQFKDQDQGYRSAMAQSEELKYVMTHAHEIGYAKALAMYNSARSDLLTGLRKLQGTGAALSEQELANIEKQLPQLTESMIPGFAATFARDGGTQMDIGMRNLSRHHFGSMDNLIEGVTLDPNDRMYGRHVTNYLNERAHYQNAESQAAAQ